MTASSKGHPGRRPQDYSPDPTYDSDDDQRGSSRDGEVRRVRCRRRPSQGQASGSSNAYYLPDYLERAAFRAAKDRGVRIVNKLVKLGHGKLHTWAGRKTLLRELGMEPNQLRQLQRDLSKLRDAGVTDHLEDRKSQRRNTAVITCIIGPDGLFDFERDPNFVFEYQVGGQPRRALAADLTRPKLTRGPRKSDHMSSSSCGAPPPKSADHMSSGGFDHMSPGDTQEEEAYGEEEGGAAPAALAAEAAPPSSATAVTEEPPPSPAASPPATARDSSRPKTAQEGGRPATANLQTQARNAKTKRGRAQAPPPPDGALKGVCRTWARLWMERHGTDYVPSHFCYIDGIALGRELTADQVPLLEPAMRAFQGDPKTRLQLLNKFCRVAGGLIATEAAKRRASAEEERQSGGTIWEPPEERPAFDASKLPPSLRGTAVNLGMAESRSNAPAPRIEEARAMRSPAEIQQDAEAERRMRDWERLESAASKAATIAPEESPTIAANLAGFYRLGATAETAGSGPERRPPQERSPAAQRTPEQVRAENDRLLAAMNRKAAKKRLEVAEAVA